jgi:ComF family protein
MEPALETRNSDQQPLHTSVMRALIHRAKHLIYPPTCASCRVAILEPHGLCASCWSSLKLIERPFCERLGTPFDLDIGGTLLSPLAIASPPLFERARAVASYDEIARALVYRLKYSDHMELGHALGVMMARAGAELLSQADMLIPIPLHWSRLWHRRYNQSMVLAQAVSRAYVIRPILIQSPLLKRVKRTLHQTGLTREQRSSNLKGAFHVPEKARTLLRDKNIVLIDDVLTTGATVNAATKVLLKAGAARVDVLTFARVTLGDDDQVLSL